ncbi:unnamed protein product [Periconia digitata]|uniref:Uncharacterized protein n=1 Tax=Periconia digitata TaxID=1303443 RepID=A0A9W4XQD3_9PLEO|nr:unnamed protein product [Periconia digitata]
MISFPHPARPRPLRLFSHHAIDKMAFKCTPQLTRSRSPSNMPPKRPPNTSQDHAAALHTLIVNQQTARHTAENAQKLPKQPEKLIRKRGRPRKLRENPIASTYTPEILWDLSGATGKHEFQLTDDYDLPPARYELNEQRRAAKYKEDVESHANNQRKYLSRNAKRNTEVADFWPIHACEENRTADRKPRKRARKESFENSAVRPLFASPHMLFTSPGLPQLNRPPFPAVSTSTVAHEQTPTQSPSPSDILDPNTRQTGYLSPVFPINGCARATSSLTSDPFRYPGEKAPTTPVAPVNLPSDAELDIDPLELDLSHEGRYSALYPVDQFSPSAPIRDQQPAVSSTATSATSTNPPVYQHVFIQRTRPELVKDQRPRAYEYMKVGKGIPHG